MINIDKKGVKVIAIALVALFVGLLGLSQCDTSAQASPGTLSQDGTYVQKKDSLVITLKSARSYSIPDGTDRGCKAVDIKVYDVRDTVFIQDGNLYTAYAKVAVNPNNKAQIIVKDAQDRLYRMTLYTVGERTGDPRVRGWLVIETQNSLTLLSEFDECELLKVNLN